MTTVAMYIMLVAVFWGGWPLVARTAGEAGVVGSLIMSSVAVVPIAAAILQSGASMPSASATVAYSIAGIMMGLGFSHSTQ